MASNESMCLKRGTFSDENITNGNTDDKTELTNTGFCRFFETDEVAKEKLKMVQENTELNFDSDLNEESK